MDTSLAFNVMSLSNDCTGSTYDPPLIGKTSLPVASDSTLVQRISDEDFSGGFGTRIEGALRGIANYTANNQAAGREMIGVLITDGDATQCDTNNSNLAAIIADHLTNTGLRTFIIGMNGANEDNLEELAVAGGADPHDDFCGDVATPCHYWNVGDASGDVLANALQAISQQAVPLPCEIDVTGLTAPEGEVLDYGRVNVTLTQGETVTTIPQVGNPGACPLDQPAWYYDVPNAPTKIHLCENACDTVSAAGTEQTSTSSPAARVPSSCSELWWRSFVSPPGPPRLQSAACASSLGSCWRARSRHRPGAEGTMSRTAGRTARTAR